MNPHRKVKFGNRRTPASGGGLLFVGYAMSRKDNRMKLSDKAGTGKSLVLFHL
jgi:hypothetical protein